MQEAMQEKLRFSENLWSLGLMENIEPLKSDSNYDLLD